MTDYKWLCKLCGEPMTHHPNRIHSLSFEGEVFLYLAHNDCWNKADLGDRLLACRRHCDAFHDGVMWWAKMLRKVCPGWELMTIPARLQLAQQAGGHHWSELAEAIWAGRI